MNLQEKQQLVDSFLGAIKIGQQYSQDQIVSNGLQCINAEVTDIIDAGQGKYKINYAGNEMEALAKEEYNIGDSVLVILTGSYDDPKYIYIKTGVSDSLSSTMEKSDTYYYIERSGNLLEMLNPEGVTENSLKLSSYEINDKKITATKTGLDFQKNFSSLMKDESTFCFSYNIRTELPLEQKTAGSYGCTLSLPLYSIDEKGERTDVDYEVVINSDNMIGDIYNFLIPTRQNIYFQLNKKYKYNQDKLPKLLYYSKGFKEDNKKIEEYDIFFTNISLMAVEEIGENERKGAFFTIKASESRFFSNNGSFSSSKTLTPEYRIDGKKSSLENKMLLWFTEDVTIRSGSEYFNTNGGVGWRILNEKQVLKENEIGTSVDEYISMPELEVDRSSVGGSRRYKCVVLESVKTQKENATAFSKLEDIITLLDNDSGRSVSLELNADQFLPEIGEARIKVISYLSGVTDNEEIRNEALSNFRYSFLREDKKGRTISSSSLLDVFSPVFDEDNLETTVTKLEGADKVSATFSISTSLIDELNTVRCTVYYSEENDGYAQQIIGSAQKTIKLSDGINFSVEILNDNIQYSYDANGDSPAAGDNFSGPAVLRHADITPLTFVIRNPDGSEITPNEYKHVYYKWIIPKNSLFEVQGGGKNENNGIEDSYIYDGWCLTGKPVPLQYTIVDKYNSFSALKYITLHIEFNNSEFDIRANITFSKEGQQGTNGTAYRAILVSGGVNPESSFPAGELTSDGLEKRLNLLYNMNEADDTEGFKETQGLYVYDYTIPITSSSLTEDEKGLTTNRNRRLIKFSPNIKMIFPRVWKDGVEIGPDKYEIEWSMFEPDYTNPYFDVIAEGGDYNAASIRWRKDQNGKYIHPTGSIDKIKSCNIVQAKIKPNAQQFTTDEQGNPIEDDSKAELRNLVIYCYYPIDFTIVDMPAEDISTVPLMTGGFNEVMYATDMTNPAYDSKLPFKCNLDKFANLDAQLGGDSHINEFFKIDWETSYHLHGEHPKDTITVDSKTTEEPRETEYIVTPDSKYDDGGSLNYVKTTFSLKEGVMKEAEANIKRLETLIPETELTKLDFSTTLDFLTNFRDRWNSLDINSYLNISGDFTNFKREATSFTDKINSLILEVARFDSGQIGYNEKTNYSNVIVSRAEDSIKQAEIDIKKEQEYIKKYPNASTSMGSSTKQDYDDRLGKLEELKTLVPNLNSLLVSYYDYSTGIKNNLDIIESSKEQTDITKQLLFNIAALERSINDLSLAESHAKSGGVSTLINKVTELLILMQAYNKYANEIKDKLDTCREAFKQLVKNIINATVGGDYSGEDSLNKYKTLPQTSRIIKFKQQINSFCNNNLIKSNSVKDAENHLKHLYDNVLSVYFESVKENDNFYEEINKIELKKGLEDSINKKINDIAQTVEENKATLETAKQIFENGHYSISIIRSIVLYANRYSMSNINGWDGSKLETGDGTYLLAPQVGAGVKDERNGFTGLVMGIRNVDKAKNGKDDKQGQVGLFGYSSGQQSLFINAENGSAIFGIGGKGGGQIIIDPSDAENPTDGTIAAEDSKRHGGMIYSSNYWKKYNSVTGFPSDYSNSNRSGEKKINSLGKSYQDGQGMMIDFSNAEIRFGSDKFYVTSEGNMHAGGNGVGDVGGWNLFDNSIQSASYKEGSMGVGIFSSYNTPTKDENGKIVSDDPRIIFGSSSGKMYSGNHNELNKTSEGFYLDNTGLSIHDGLKITVPKDGKSGLLEVGNIAKNHWKIYGDEEVSYIGFNEEGKDKSVFLTTKGLRIGSKFNLEADGSSFKIAYGTDALDPSDNDGKISYNTEEVFLGKEGIRIGNYFRVAKDDKNGCLQLGHLSGDHWNMGKNGNNAAIYFGNTSDKEEETDNEDIGNSEIRAKVYLGTDKIALGEKKDGTYKFSVNRLGELNATKGKIGGWTIKKNSLSANKIIISGTGLIKHVDDAWKINSDGYASFTRGTIAGWSMVEEDEEKKLPARLTAGSMSIKSDGSMSGPGWHINKDGSASFTNVTDLSFSNDGGKIGNNNVSSDGYIQLSPQNFNLDGKNISSLKWYPVKVLVGIKMEYTLNKDPLTVDINVPTYSLSTSKDSKTGAITSVGLVQGAYVKKSSNITIPYPCGFKGTGKVITLNLLGDGNDSPGTSDPQAGSLYGHKIFEVSTYK